jgi:hypothetical protein
MYGLMQELIKWKKLNVQKAGLLSSCLAATSALGELVIVLAMTLK